MPSRMTSRKKKPVNAESTQVTIRRYCISSARSQLILLTANMWLPTPRVRILTTPPKSCLSVHILYVPCIHNDDESVVLSARTSSIVMPLSITIFAAVLNTFPRPRQMCKCVPFPFIFMVSAFRWLCKSPTHSIIPKHILPSLRIQSCTFFRPLHCYER